MRVLAEVALVVIAAVGATAGLSSLAARLPHGDPVFEPGLRPRADADIEPAQLLRLDRVVEASASSGLDVHSRLRPVLVEIARARLARRGLQLDRDIDEARRLLGPAAWELVRPERPPPWDRDAPGIAPAELEAIIESLEAV